MKKFQKKIPVALLVLSLFLFGGWGSAGHKIINGSAKRNFPAKMDFLSLWGDSLAIHASDADNRKSYDPDEDPKHYIDIDTYSDFNKYGRIIQNYDSIVAVFGKSFVIDQGILPWAILNTCDSLTEAFKKREWHKAMLIASDLGHYVGDAHMPLHITKNYNGQYTGQSGVHSRYESDMINKYSSQISYAKDSVMLVSDVTGYVFGMVYGNYRYVDSVLAADKSAKASAGSTSGNTYYQKLWENSGAFTILLLKNASASFANLVYTCWVNAGSPVFFIDFVETDAPGYHGFRLNQNFPNPFNPETTISFYLEEESFVNLKVFDAAGRETACLLNNRLAAGTHSAVFNVGNLPSGVYFYKLMAGNKFAVKKLLILK